MQAMLRIYSDDNALTDEIQWLGELLDEAIIDIIGDDGLRLIDAVRRLSIDQREGNLPAGERLQSLLSTLTSHYSSVLLGRIPNWLTLCVRNILPLPLPA